MGTNNLKKVYKIRLKKGDKVVVLSGKHKNKTGTIVSTHPADNTATVEGINVIKKAVKPDRKYPQGGIIEVTKPINVSKLAIVEPTSKKPSKIGYKVNKDGEKVRVYKSTGKEIK